MEPAIAVTRVIDELNRRIGIVAIYMVLFSSLICAINAILRYSTNGLLWLEQYLGGGFVGERWATAAGALRPPENNRRSSALQSRSGLPA